LFAINGKSDPVSLNLRSNGKYSTTIISHTVKQHKLNHTVKQHKLNPTVKQHKLNPTVKQHKLNHTVKQHKLNHTVKQHKLNHTVKQHKLNHTVKQHKLNHTVKQQKKKVSSAYIGHIVKMDERRRRIEVRTLSKFNISTTTLRPDGCMQAMMTCTDNNRSQENRAVLQAQSDETVLQAQSNETVLQSQSDETVLQSQSDETVFQAQSDETVIQSQSDGVHLFKFCDCCKILTSLHNSQQHGLTTTQSKVMSLQFGCGRCGLMSATVDSVKKCFYNHDRVR